MEDNMEGAYGFRRDEPGYAEKVRKMSHQIAWEWEQRRQAAILLGRKGGQSRSEKKQAASRENGKKGGRPKAKPSQAACP